MVNWCLGIGYSSIALVASHRSSLRPPLYAETSNTHLLASAGICSAEEGKTITTSEFFKWLTVIGRYLDAYTSSPTLEIAVQINATLKEII